MTYTKEGIFLFNPIPATGEYQSAEYLFEKIIEDQSIEINYFGYNLYNLQHKNKRYLLGKIDGTIVFGPVCNKRFNSYSLSAKATPLFDKLNLKTKQLERLSA
jgi:hypothetical protein